MKDSRPHTEWLTLPGKEPLGVLVVRMTLMWAGLILPVLMAAQPGNSQIEENLREAERLLDAARYTTADSLIKAISPAIQQLGDPALEAQALHLSGFIALEQGGYQQASEAFSQALERTNAALPAGHPARGQAHNDLGVYFFSIGQIDSARWHHEKALAIRQAHFGRRHEKVGDSYNNLGNIFQATGRSEQALNYYRQVLEIRKRSSTNDPVAVASALNNLGNAFLSLGQPDEATAVFRQSLAIRKREMSSSHPLIGRSLQNLGNTFYQAGRLDSAGRYYLAALTNARINYDSVHPRLADLYENLGNCALQQNQPDSAAHWHLRALRIREGMKEIDPISPAASYLHLGDVNRQKGDYLEAMQLTEQGWAILQQYLPETDPYLAVAWEKVGLAHLNLGHLKQASDAYSKVLDIRWKVYGPNHPFIAGAFTNLGNVYWQQSDYPSAVYNYREALKIWEQFQGNYQREKAELYSNIGNNYLKQKSWTEALDAYRTALTLIEGRSEPLEAALWQQTGVAYDGLQQYGQAMAAFQKALQHYGSSGNNHQHQLLFTLSAKANTLLHFFHKNGTKDSLDAAARVFSESLALLKEQQNKVLHTESRQKSLALHYELFAGAIDCQLAQWELTQDSFHLWQAFAYSEESKGLRIKEKWSARIQPDGGPKGGEGLSSLARVLHTDEASARALSRRLRGENGLLAFFSGSENLFWFFLKEGRLRAGRLGGMEEITGLISGMGESIVQFPVSGSALKIQLDSVYRHHALKLYQLIWKPLEFFFADTRNLIIVPDGALAYLPFAVLLGGQPEQAMRYRTYPYLLQRYQISYAYSAALLARVIAQPGRGENLDCLAMAPEFLGHDPPLSPLNFNTIEVEELRKRIGADVLEGPEATLAAFRERAPRYQILHLATHGVANIFRSEFSYLAFSKTGEQENGRLYVQDLYNMDIPAEMIVMSACESGVGLYQAGEGAISLGRGFATAGARSVISTLWNVNDAKTADFMQEFYRHLQQGIAKDAAIRRVQQDYLKKASQEEAHPFFWAAYLPLGDMTPLPIGNKWSLSRVYIIAGILLILLFLLGRPLLLKNFSK